MIAAAGVQPRCLIPPPQQLHGLPAASSSSRRSRIARPLASRATLIRQQQQPGESGGSSSGTNTSHGSSSSSGSVKRKPGPKTHTAEAQPQLQAWLQQEQRLSATEADKQARRLAHIFGSQQAALDGLPATFEWCRSRGLTGLQTAQLLDHIASQRQENVVQFVATVQHDWQLLDSHVAAHVEPLRRAGAKLPKHTSLAEVLASNDVAALALVMPPGHVEAWLAAVSQRLPAAAIGRLLLSTPNIVCGSPVTALAAITWAVDVLCVPDPAAFSAKASTLLSREVCTLQRNLDSLQQGLDWTAEQARQLALKRPVILMSSPATVQAVLAWLRQLFPDAEQLAGVLSRGPHLLNQSEQRLQGNADTLQQALGWRDGDGHLAAFVATYPQPFATVNLSSKRTADKLRLLTQVVGISLDHCLTEGSSYLKTGLETMAAVYMLVQARAPHLLFDDAGELHLSWVINANKPPNLRRLGMTRPQFNAFVREWPRSEEGRRLLEGLRAGSVGGWPRPPLPSKAQQRHRAEAELRQQARTARCTSTAALGNKRQGRARRSEQVSENGPKDETAA